MTRMTVEIRRETLQSQIEPDPPGSSHEISTVRVDTILC